MTVTLQDEFGGVIDEVHDIGGLISALLPSLEDDSYTCLRFIDPYGDTYFNRLQMRLFIAEWGRTFGMPHSEKAKELFGRIKGLAERCAIEPHLYLKFMGD